MKTVEYYISKGFDTSMAQYFAAGRKKIVNIAPGDDFSLLLTFEGGERRVYDARPLLQKNTVFEPLLDSETFRRVYLDEDGCVSWDIDPNVDSREVWSNKVDISPETCYVDSVPI